MPLFKDWYSCKTKTDVFRPHQLYFLGGPLFYYYLCNISISNSMISSQISVIFGINTTSDISKLLYIISRAVRWVKLETIFKYLWWYLWQISHTNPAIICYITTHKRFVIFTCWYFKLSWNITALSQWNCRKFSCSSII